MTRGTPVWNAVSRPIAALVLTLFMFMWAPCTVGAVRLHGLFTDHMVLQQKSPVPVWGQADPGESVTVRIAGQSKTTKADAQGRWKVLLNPIPGNGPYDLTVVGTNRIMLRDVLVGEVWIGSGQSNMAMSVRRVANAEKEIAAADYPNIRLFKVPLRTNQDPQADVKGAWVVCSPKTIPDFSATAYFFGREIHRRLQVPVGLIQSCWGGTPAEAWTRREVLESDPDFKPILERFERACANLDQATKRYQERLAKWREQVKAARKTGKRPPRRPRPPLGPNPSHAPSGLWNAMIHPLIPFAIRGVIWYQGESNAGRARQYRKLFPAMIRDWRKQWAQGDFPFLFVQLANFRRPQTDPNEKSAWAELREAQFMTYRTVPNTGMAVIIDIGEADDIHPKNKQEVGRRLALWALAKTYGRNVIYSGPLYREMRKEGAAIRIFFDEVDGGLTARGPELKGFVIAGPDKIFHWAQARIDGNTVLVSAPEEPEPAAVRYGWANNPPCNLYNKAGLPASPFRTDAWPGVTDGRK